MSEWVTRRQYPETVIMECAHEVLDGVDREFSDRHPQLARHIALLAMQRLDLHPRSEE